MVERAEAVLRALGFQDLRVRHYGDTARIEVPLVDIARMVEPAVREQVVEGLKSAGYRRITLDLQGFRSGSLNQDLPVPGAT